MRQIQLFAVLFSLCAASEAISQTSAIPASVDPVTGFLRAAPRNFQFGQLQAGIATPGEGRLVASRDSVAGPLMASSGPENAGRLTLPAGLEHRGARRPDKAAPVKASLPFPFVFGYALALALLLAVAAPVTALGFLLLARCFAPVCEQIRGLRSGPCPPAGSFEMAARIGVRSVQRTV